MLHMSHMLTCVNQKILANPRATTAKTLCYSASEPLVAMLRFHCGPFGVPGLTEMAPLQRQAISPFPLSQRYGVAVVTGAADDRTSVHPLEGFVPIVAFLIAFRLGGVRIAVGAATVLGLIVGYRRWRAGLRTGWVVPALTIGLIARGVAAIITNSEDVYFGIGIAARLAFGLALLASALLGRPLARHAASKLLAPSPADRSHQAWKRTMVALSVLGGLYFVASAGIELFLFRRASVEGFVVLRLLANWPLAAILTIAAVTLAQRWLSEIPGFGSVQDRLERQLAAISHQSPQSP